MTGVFDGREESTQLIENSVDLFIAYSNSNVKPVLEIDVLSSITPLFQALLI